MSPENPLAPKSFDYREDANCLALYDRFRDYTKHEDNLINHRLSWNLTIQGFLFASFTLTLTKIADIRIEAAKIVSVDHLFLLQRSFNDLHVLLDTIVVVGIGVSLSVYLNLITAMRSLMSLENQWLGLYPAYERTKHNRNAPKVAHTPEEETAAIAAADQRERLGLPGVSGGGASKGLFEAFEIHAPNFLPLVSIVTWIVLWIYVRHDL